MATPLSTPRYGALHYDTASETESISLGTRYDEPLEAGRRESLKVVVVGAASVGKTTLIEALTRHWSNEPCDMSARVAAPARHTIGVDFRTIRLPGNRLTLQLWDTAGQERFAALPTVVLRNAALLVLAFEPARPSTWERLVDEWAPRASAEAAHAVAAGAAAPLVVVVATKLDQPGSPLPELTHERAVARGFNARAFLNTSVLWPASLATLATTLEQLLVDYRAPLEAAVRRRARAERWVTAPRNRALALASDVEPRKQEKQNRCAC